MIKRLFACHCSILKIPDKPVKSIVSHVDWTFTTLSFLRKS